MKGLAIIAYLAFDYVGALCYFPWASDITIPYFEIFQIYTNLGGVKKSIMANQMLKLMIGDNKESYHHMPTHPPDISSGCMGANRGSCEILGFFYPPHKLLILSNISCICESEMFPINFGFGSCPATWYGNSKNRE